MSNILVIAEVRGGVAKRPSLETVTAALQLAGQTGGKVVVVAGYYCMTRLPNAAVRIVLMRKKEGEANVDYIYIYIYRVMQPRPGVHFTFSMRHDSN